MAQRRSRTWTGAQARASADIRAIAEGLPDGGRFPVTIGGLAARNGVSKATAYRAARALEAQGVIEMRQGDGIFARHFVPVVSQRAERLRREHWHGGLAIQALDAGVPPVCDRVIVERLMVPPGHAAQALGPGPVFERSRRYLRSGVPAMLATGWYPQWLVRLAPRITGDDTGPGGVYELMEQAGHGPAQFEEIVTARPATTGEIGELELPPRMSVVLAVTRIAQDAHGHCVEVQDMIHDAKQYKLIYQIRA